MVKKIDEVEVWKVLFLIAILSIVVALLATTGKAPSIKTLPIVVLISFGLVLSSILAFPRYYFGYFELKYKDRAPFWHAHRVITFIAALTLTLAMCYYVSRSMQAIKYLAIIYVLLLVYQSVIYYVELGRQEIHLGCTVVTPCGDTISGRRNFCPCPFFFYEVSLGQ